MSGGKILIADNELTHTKVIGWNLELAGYEVDIVHDGEAALRRAREWRPNVLICDLVMPRLDGWEVVRELKTRADTQSIPVLMLTGVRRDLADAMPHSHEPDWFMTKPFELEHLEGAISQLMAHGAGRN